MTADARARQAFIDGTQPLFAIHQSHSWQGFAPALRHVRRASPSVTSGVVVSLPKASPANAEKRLQQAADFRIADPELWLANSSGFPGAETGKPKIATKYRWWASVPTHADATRPRWVEKVLESQRHAGANVMLSTTSWVDGANARAGLADAMRWVSESRQQVGSDPMFVNLAFDGAWLSNPSLRALLLDEIVESDEHLWYLRFYWPKMTVRYGQLTNSPLLDGYAELAAVAADEDKRLVLPNSGLTGWVTTAIGASGFSTGIGWPEQAFTPPIPGGGRKGQPPPPRKKRYFERTILHTVERTTHERLQRRAGHITCSCAYSASLTSGPTWDHNETGYHYLVCAAALTEALAVAPDRRIAARSLVAASQAFVGTLTGAGALLKDDVPRHLPLWHAMLQ